MGKLVMLELIGSLKIGYFILEKEMAKLNQKKDLKQPDRPHPVGKFYFILEKNQQHIQCNCLHVF